jgi:hypothetical protein
LKIPVPLETFVGYGMAFQERFVPMLEEKRVDSLGRGGSALELMRFALGAGFTSKRMTAHLSRMMRSAPRHER